MITVSACWFRARITTCSPLWSACRFAGRGCFLPRMWILVFWLMVKVLVWPLPAATAWPFFFLWCVLMVMESFWTATMVPWMRCSPVLFFPLAAVAASGTPTLMAMIPPRTKQKRLMFSSRYMTIRPNKHLTGAARKSSASLQGNAHPSHITVQDPAATGTSRDRKGPLGIHHSLTVAALLLNFLAHPFSSSVIEHHPHLTCK